jgi:hypothetical protein
VLLLLPSVLAHRSTPPPLELQGLSPAVVADQKPSLQWKCHRATPLSPPLWCCTTMVRSTLHHHAQQIPRPTPVQGLSPAVVAVETLPRCPPPSAASPVLRRYGEPHPLSPCPTDSLYDLGACDAASATPSRPDHRRQSCHGRSTARGDHGSVRISAHRGHGPQQPLGPLRPWTDRGHGRNTTCYCSPFSKF